MRQLLARTVSEATVWERRVCFALAMLYAAGCAFLALRQAFASPYMLPDDAREHVFWMIRYLDPRLLPNDQSADYFQSLAPGGYAALYWLLAQAGIAPLLASKFIPSVLSLVATGYFFGLAWRVLRLPALATFAAILFSQSLWLNSDLSSGTPRAFFYPLFVAFLYYQVRGSIIGVLGTVALEALFFPPAALLSLGVLGWDIVRWENGFRLPSFKESNSYLTLVAALAMTLLCLWPYLHQVGAAGPLVTYAQARAMPEFGPEGRVPVFLSSWWGYWVGGNAGIHNLPTRPPWFLAALLWPVLRRFPNRFPLLNAIPRGVRPVPQMIGAALSLFFAAHLLLFRLYLPNRYTQSVMRIVLVLLGSVVLLALVDAALRWARKRPALHGVAALGVTALLALIVAYPLLLPAFPTGGYVEGTAPGLYKFFARQPPHIRVASLADEANNLPLLCRRSNIIGEECAVPFHLRYYLPLRDRGLQLARAQYSADLTVLQQCVRDQQIDFWLLDRKAFSKKYWHKSRLLRQLRLSAPDEALGEAKGAKPLLAQPPPGTIAYQDSRFILLDAHRLLALPAKARAPAR